MWSKKRRLNKNKEHVKMYDYSFYYSSGGTLRKIFEFYIVDVKLVVLIMIFVCSSGLTIVNPMKLSQKV